MAERHGHELAPAGEAAGVALGAMLPHGLLELTRGNSCNIWLKMLDTRVTAAMLLLQGVAPLNASRSRVLPPPLKRSFGQEW
jgi:hypothetical protein